MYIAGTSTVCSGNSVTLTGSGVSSYTWSANAGSATTNTVSISPSATDTYTLTGMNGTCTNTATITVTVNASPTVTAQAASDTICALNSTGLTATGATSYNWAPNTGLSSTSGSSVTGTYSVAGVYNYTVTGNQSGCTGTSTVSVVVLACTGVNEANNVIASIFPNPSKGNITVNFGQSSGSKVVVLDMIGNIVYQSTANAGTSKMNIDLGNMPKGMYLITVTNAAGSATQKMIIE
jgi:hypothetical protein